MRNSLGQQAQQHLNKGSSHPAEPGWKGRENAGCQEESRKPMSESEEGGQRGKSDWASDGQKVKTRVKEGKGE